ncbi:hypothetical protein [Pseudarthrobacter sp. BIM B-2242]|uniref:hypothetical protein n=1 Tax=Pseudarthrobacter sp. BIM B-2242 TaxID=2772401 RepID=UPI00168BFA2F|nr:hypothetical protein [Pseudarthrobacter sp. BIM B-2242]QOD03847.1 hypothetical protein IDT60_01670 [Pseudarthrobacter sp. BIM B-2242]
MTEKNTSDQTESSQDNPEAKGIRAGLTEAQRAMLASKSRGGDSGLQSVGKNHKPTHASGKQGPAEKKVRW